jgi:hypothetical protein
MAERETFGRGEWRGRETGHNGTVTFVARVLSRFSGVPHGGDKTLSFVTCEVAGARKFSSGMIEGLTK